MRIAVITPGGGSQSLTLGGEPVSIGRAHDNTLSFPEDASLSRHHLVIEKPGTEWTVRDCGSKNHTFVNGARIEGAHPLKPGDRIEAGQLAIQCDPPTGEEASKVHFVPGTSEATPQYGTVMTSLEEVLSAETPGALSGRLETTEQRGAHGLAFNNPVVSALMKAGTELAGHRPLPELFRLILDLSLEAVGAERGVLMTKEGDQLVEQATRGKDFRISTYVRDRVLNERASLLVKDTALEEAFRGRHSIDEHNVRSMMAVPLQTEERVTGLIYVDSRFFMKDLTVDDLNLLTVLGNVAATRIERQRLAEIEQKEQILAMELGQAAEIQRRLLPERAPEVAGFDLAGFNAPCRTVGGDYYDFFPYPDGRVGLVLGDVAGKGMAAALLMSTLQARVQVLAEDAGDLGTLMSRLDRVMAERVPTSRFVTLFFCVIDPVSGRMTYANAGHNPPIVVHADGRTEKLDKGGMVLGIYPGRGYEQFECRLEPGDLLAIYSDGITEGLDPREEEYGEDRLAELLCRRRSEKACQLVLAINEDVARWTAGAPAADDRTLIIARRIG